VPQRDRARAALGPGQVRARGLLRS
jgi:hypothetical protein